MRDINPQNPYGHNERSIRNIPITHKRHVPREAISESRVRYGRRARRRLLWVIASVIVLCTLGSMLLSTVFAGATVRVSPRTAAVSPTGTLLAQLNAPVGGLPYQIVSIMRSATTTVPANGTAEVSRQASGLVTIYNNYSTASQRLIANTRLEAPDGRIYRIRDSVVVPGMSGGNPGSVTATAFADSPGDAYNRSDSATFTIPGFKGDPRYAKFSAKSQGPVQGGFVGPQPAVAPADLASAKSSLQSALDSAVRAAAASGIPEGYVAIPGTLGVIFGDTAEAAAGSGTAQISQSATAAGVIVRQADLAAAIAQKTVDGYKGEAVLLDPASTLNVSVASSTNLTKGSLMLTLSGSATLVWQFDPAAVKAALLGRATSEFQKVLQSFAPAIHCTETSPCDASIRPFWSSHFPTDPAKIMITIQPGA